MKKYKDIIEYVRPSGLELEEKVVGDASHLNLLVDSETQALVGFVIFQQTHLLFASVTIYTTVDQPPPKKNGRH